MLAEWLYYPPIVLLLYWALARNHASYSYIHNVDFGIYEYTVFV